MNQSQIQQYLASHDLFRGLPDADLAFLASQAAVTEATEGQLLARQGDRADRFLIILEGEIVVEVPAIAGPPLEITRLAKDQVFGWSWLIEPYRTHFNARAARAARLLDFDGTAILQRAEQDPAFGYGLFKRFSALMGQRLESAQRKMMDQWSPSGFA